MKKIIFTSEITDEFLKDCQEFLGEDFMEDDENLPGLSDDELYVYACDQKYYEFKNFKMDLQFNNVYALIGSAQTWRGKYTILPKVLKKSDHLIDLILDYDEVVISENSHGKVYIELQHHDGRHNFELVQLNKKGKTIYNNGNIDLEEIFKNPEYRKNGRLIKLLRW